MEFSADFHLRSECRMVRCSSRKSTKCSFISSLAKINKLILMVEGEFNIAKRPKLGIGVMILNEYDEVLCSQRIAPGTLHHLVWQFPGGY